MIVRLNGELQEFDESATVADVGLALGVADGGRGIAVALDGEVVPRARWRDTPLHDGALVEVVAAIQGG